MFIIEKPYASELLIDTVIQNDWFVLRNTAIEEAEIEEGAFRFCSSTQAKNYYIQQEYPLIYSNSENAIHWILENLPQSNLSKFINTFKDKVVFRKLLQEIYPNFYFQEVEYSDLSRINLNNIKFPVILKPAVGFLSLGVHTVKDAAEWDSVVKNLEQEMANAENLYPKNVINSSKFIIEEIIEGDEFAVDAYYDRNGDAVILNIFEHPFFNNKDVRDRIYIMSTSIMVEYMAKFAQLLRQIGELMTIKNFPLHIEVRVTKDGMIIPIEINPMRFAGWCTTDVAKYAWGINVYEYFYKQIKPDWNNILANSGKELFYFSMAEVPTDISREEIHDFDYRQFLSNYSNVLELRKIKFNTNPLFAIIFGSTNDKDEISRILSLSTKDFIK